MINIPSRPFSYSFLSTIHLPIHLSFFFLVIYVFFFSVQFSVFFFQCSSFPQASIPLTHPASPLASPPSRPMFHTLQSHHLSSLCTSVICTCLDSASVVSSLLFAVTEQPFTAAQHSISQICQLIDPARQTRRRRSITIEFYQGQSSIGHHHPSQHHQSSPTDPSRHSGILRIITILTITTTTRSS